MIMVLPMACLAIGAVVAGLVGSPWLHHAFFRLMGEADVHEGLDVPLLVGSTAVAALGIWLAWTIGVKRRNLLPAGLRPLGSTLYTWAANKYYVDEVYDRTIIQPFLAATRWLARFDLGVIDGAVNGAGDFAAFVSRLKERFDQLVVDRIVNGTASIIRRCGSALRWIQTGIIQQYLLVVVVSLVVLSLILRR